MKKQFLLLVIVVYGMSPLIGMKQTSKKLFKDKRLYTTSPSKKGIKKTLVSIPDMSKKGTDQQVNLEVSGDVQNIIPRTPEKNYIEVNTTEEKVRVTPDDSSPKGIKVLRFPKKQSSFALDLFNQKGMEQKRVYSTLNQQPIENLDNNTEESMGFFSWDPRAGDKEPTQKDIELYSQIKQYIDQAHHAAKTYNSKTSLWQRLWGDKATINNDIQPELYTNCVRSGFAPSFITLYKANAAIEIPAAYNLKVITPWGTLNVLTGKTEACHSYILNRLLQKSENPKIAWPPFYLRKPEEELTKSEKEKVTGRIQHFWEKLMWRAEMYQENLQQEKRRLFNEIMGQGKK